MLVLIQLRVSITDPYQFGTCRIRFFLLFFFLGSFEFSFLKITHLKMERKMQSFKMCFKSHLWNPVRYLSMKILCPCYLVITGRIFYLRIKKKPR